MKKGTTTINLDTKSQLAKLLATENIIIQHNNVSTASFNTKTRVLTLPIFKESHGDVYDMLIAHECAHALFTPQNGWKKIQDDDELRTYVNVLEDTRIDKKIQKKYPGVVRNYINGFDILEKQNFFGMKDKDLNKELMLIDKINLRSKSSNRLPFIFDDKANNWLDKVDSIKSFTDVVRVAKDMLNWQKKQVEQMKKLPDFDDHPLIKNYELSDEDATDPQDKKEQDQNSESADNPDVQDEKNDKRDSEEKATDKDLKDKEKENAKTATQHAKGADGDPKPKKLKAITNDFFEQKKESLLDKKTSYVYGTLPKPNLNQCLVSYKTFLNDFRKHISDQVQSNPESTLEYKRWILDKFKKFRTENKKTVMYLVKEFEMKKAASAYKRANTDKTGVIDPLKLRNYKFSEDIFKRMTIIPDGKNHGMIMLLDWSGSMSDCIADTVAQLINLVEFTRKVNIPFEVYFFTSERDSDERDKQYWNYKYGDFCFDEFKLVNCLSHRMKKNEFEESLLYMFHMAKDYDQRWSRNWSDPEYPKGSNYHIPDKYYLGNTPLNEALIVCNNIIPEFQKKYKVEKLTFITLTDGGGNSFRHNQIIPIPDKPTRAIDEYEIKDAKAKKQNYIKRSIDYESKVVITHKNKKIILTDGWYGSAMTDTLLSMIKSDHNPTIVGFYIIKRIRRWELDRFIGSDYKDYEHKEKLRLKIQKSFRTDNAAIVYQSGYDKYFLLNGKKLKVQNFNLQDATVKKGTGAELKRIFGKSMKNRLVSRVVLNKFIAEVA